jgi:hypothetical protein
MKLVQFFLPGRSKRVGMVRGDQVLDLTAPAEGIESVLDLLLQGKSAAGVVTRAEWLARSLRRRPLDWAALHNTPARRAPHLLLPIDPPEVWRAIASGSGPRPGFAFKGTAPRCVGPRAAVGIRSDAEHSIVDACLAAVLGPTGSVIAYTACLDLTAADLAALGPAYASQAKSYAASCALGPVLVTADELGGPRTLQVSYRLKRGGADQPEGQSRADVPGDFDDLAAWLGRDNILAGGTVVTVAVGRFGGDGTGLEAGDQLELEIEGIGQLANPVRRLGGPA